MDNLITLFEELTRMVETLDPEIVAGGIIFYTVLFAAIAAIVTCRCLMTAIGYSKMYRKAGVAGWKAFIPVYSTYNNYKISWNRETFLVFVALNCVLNSLGGAETLVPQLAAAVTGITLIAVMIKQNVMMANLFGKGKGTGIALMFFPGITSLILGLGKAEFQGKIMENN